MVASRAEMKEMLQRLMKTAQNRRLRRGFVASESAAVSIFTSALSIVLLLDALSVGRFDSGASGCIF